jgi:probable HAF family extracellular repeat protein
VECGSCHLEKRVARAPTFAQAIFKTYADSVHGEAVARGNPDAPRCADCHGYHDILPPDNPRSRVYHANIPQTCARCHSDAQLVEWNRIPKGEVLLYYERSVHGQLLQQGKRGTSSAPGKLPAVCTDCHGVHGIRRATDPNSTVARAHLPETCGKCHESIFREWQASIHGQAVAQGIKQAPVCTDCHGEHTIRSPQDPESSVYPQHIVAISVLLCSPVVPVGAQALTLLGTLPGHVRSIAKDVSGNGTVVVGLSETASGVTRAFRWTAAEGVQDLVPSDSNLSIAYGVSADGSTVVGYMLPSLGGSFRAFRWRADTGLQEFSLLPLPGYTAGTVALATSADGSLVVRYGVHRRGYKRAFYWNQQNGMRVIMPFPNADIVYHNSANGVSLDGRYVVGFADTTASDDSQIHRVGFLWTEEGGILALNGLPTTSLYFERSAANAVSLDGMVVVAGVLTETLGWHIGRWTAGTNWIVTPVGDVNRSEATDVSANGKVVVGWTRVSTPDISHAVRWTEEKGVEDLNVVYAPLLQGVILQKAEGISPDGRYIVGQAFLPSENTYRGFLLDTGESQPVEVHGTVRLDGFVGDTTSLQGVLELRYPGQVAPVHRYLVAMNDAGGFDLMTPLNGVWDVSLTVPRFLRRTMSGVPLFGRVQLQVNLLNGDIDGDNEVTLFDFGRLVAAFGSAPGLPHWDETADLDGDGEVTLYDFGILVHNFGSVGDE